MIKPILICTALAVFLFFSKASAQVDTTHFDLGRMQLKKDFTQSVTVKGDDLAKMPFDNLAEAIDVWFNGSYTNVLSTVYVVDGNLVNDVNAYSIYDIDEVTLIQNAVTQLNGSTQNQQLILIKTKRPKGKGYGVTANGQANISSLYTNNVLNAQTNAYETGLRSSTTVYQQYYVSAYKNTDNIQFGVSADYLGDELPEIQEPAAIYNTPESFNRFRFNGYFDAKVSKSSVLDVTAGYVPQKDQEDVQGSSTGNSYNESFNESEHLFNGSVKLTTHILPGLTNVLHGDYNSYHATESGTTLEEYQGDSTATVSKQYSNNHAIVAYDNLSYDAKFGNWGIEPAANLNFRTFRDSTNGGSLSVNQAGNIIGGSSYSTLLDEHMFLLTPSINLYYKNYFNIEGGVLYNIATIGNINLKANKVLPFVSTSADVMRLIDPLSSLSVKVYGSYSVTSYLFDNYNTLGDFTNTTRQIPILDYESNETTSAYNGYEGVSYGNLPYQDNTKAFKTFSAGLSVAPSKSGLTLSYFFERRNYLSPVYVLAPYGGNFAELILSDYNTNSTLNRLALNYNFVSNSAFNWQTGINATMIDQKIPVPIGPQVNTGNNEWTGGWVNRLSYRSFFAGVDVLYQIGEKTYTLVPPNYNTITTNKINSFSLQNLYAGYRIKVAGVKNLEAFANARNIFQNQKADITDNRKYYGLGFKLSL